MSFATVRIDDLTFIEVSQIARMDTWFSPLSCGTDLCPCPSRHTMHRVYIVVYQPNNLHWMGHKRNRRRHCRMAIPYALHLQSEFERKWPMQVRKEHR